ncbi:MAG: hypothetical protein QM754_01260 [Tepidisphaeraceae bacterium]
MSRRPLSKAVQHVEMLEERRLMTTLVGGQTFDYLDAEGDVMRIRLIGNITAEFTAARVRETNNTVVIRDLIAPPPEDSDLDISTGADLFNIYIAEADSNAQIIITEVADAGAADATATPYSGDVGTIRAPDGEPLTIDPDTGDVSGATTTIDPDATGGVYIARAPAILNRSTAVTKPTSRSSTTAPVRAWASAPPPRVCSPASTPHRASTWAKCSSAAR